ncbi:hypothetical protein JCM3765_007484 [Sporobolomyces pararoseus]
MSEGNWSYNSYYNSWDCDDCDRDFNSEAALFQHLRDSNNHAWCQDCNLEFDSYSELQAHYADSDEHSYCGFCESHFDDDDDLDEHKYAEHGLCDVCSRWFKTFDGRDQHLSASHFYCSTHDRYFKSRDNLRMHMLSSAHVAATILCPAGCGHKFISYSAAAEHLESGRCSSGINREKINHYIQQWDRQGLVTTGRRLLPAASGSQNSNTPPPPRNTFEASEDSYSSQDGAYKCYFDGKLFGNLVSLNQHLNSAVHTYSTRTNQGGEKLYHCPNRDGCTREFLTLSGLLQHVEQGNCGVKKMKAVTRAIENVMGSMRSLTI